MRKRTAALVFSGALALGALGAGVAITPASADTNGNAVTSRLAAIKNALTGLVKDGTLTQAQADKVASALDQNLPHRGFGPGGPGGGFGGHGFGGGMFTAEADAAAKALHLTTAELRTQLRAGKTLADIAKAQKVDVATLITALTDTAKTQLDDAVKAGRLTQAQADTMKTNLTKRITDLVNGVRPSGGPGFGPGFGRGFGPDSDHDLGRGPGGMGNRQATPAPSTTTSAGA